MVHFNKALQLHHFNILTVSFTNTVNCDWLLTTVAICRLNYSIVSRVQIILL